MEPWEASRSLASQSACNRHDVASQSSVARRRCVKEDFNVKLVVEVLAFPVLMRPVDFGFVQAQLAVLDKGRVEPKPEELLVFVPHFTSDVASDDSTASKVERRIRQVRPIVLNRRLAARHTEADDGRLDVQKSGVL
eukprot:CAMPEP_0181193724 /NCGR_PEP_ID=MMETSP1096-20121128/13968_1 /TAXON_ID=156174 ORGANISM="Chrysochromulina ericina, Strain CCMP281" /NCGR_SAMPLE_ID=MMETSP1096 /ASSEMBLY_ACC=CAM_ASM_000453 /LENGTH=136 /DNA_ID=CAMNT_0023283203 /DNA_START=1436 /DNA_END=1847 /DNA_ORIENTATION=+